MVAGLPGTGIGGIFYFILAAMMPVREFLRTLQGKTSLKRWSVVSLQVLFVVGIFVSMWGEVWLLNCLLLWMKNSLSINCPMITSGPALTQTKTLAFASASASLVSLAFVTLSVHALRLWVNREPSLPRRRPTLAFPGLSDK